MFMMCFHEKQEQSELLGEIEALEAELKRSKVELVSSHSDVSSHSMRTLYVSQF